MDTTTTAAVRARELHKDFGEGPMRIEVLRGVDFDALLGQLTFLVGPSGCGKTTLISVIAGLLDSSGGEVRLFDQNIERFSATERILFRRKNLGFVYQQYNLLPALTAAENAAVPLLAAGVRRRAAVAATRGSGSRPRARAAFDSVRRTNRCARPCDRRKRHGIARRKRRPSR